MDEDAYREVYKEVNSSRCVFEKAINNRRCDCEKKDRKLIATREAIGCQSREALNRCSEFLDTMRKNARFALKVVTVDGPMPHNKELQVQAGGCLQLQKILFPNQSEVTTSSTSTHSTLGNTSQTSTTYDQTPATGNIFALVTEALKQYQQIDQFPYSEIVQGIVTYKSRKKRKRS